MKFAVIIPTYKEAATIGPLLDQIEEVIKGVSEHEWSVLVVDAASPDGTGAVVRDRAKRFPNLHLIEEEGKRGIALAYATGIRYAQSELGADAFIEFDGDGQHDPKDIARLARTLAAGYDCVVGSRYVPGGAVPHDWGLYRRLLSRLGSLYARILLEIPVHDVTSGLKATRLREPEFKLPLIFGELLTRDYAYKIQFLHALMRQNARITEIPIVFHVRAHDTSKSSWRDIVESLRVTAILRAQTLRQWRFLRVLAVGGAGFLVQAALFEIIGIDLKLLSPGATVVIVAIVAIFTNFFLHERFSFRDKRERAAPFLDRLARFFSLTFFGSVCVQWLFVHGVGVATGNNPTALRLAYVAGVAVGLVVSYIGYYFWVWGAGKYRPPKATTSGARAR